MNRAKRDVSSRAEHAPLGLALSTESCRLLKRRGADEYDLDVGNETGLLVFFGPDSQRFVGVLHRHVSACGVLLDVGCGSEVGELQVGLVNNGPESFSGRKVGVMMTDGADAKLLATLSSALAAEGAHHEVIAPTIAGVGLSDGRMVEARHKLGGGPSILFDSIAILVSDEGARLLANDGEARDFVADAFAHSKFVAYVASASPLLDKAGIADALDDGCVALRTPGDVDHFVELCGSLRHWARELAADVV